MVGSLIDGANASANFYSVVETAKANGLEPYTYLLMMLTDLPAAKTVEDIERLLPFNQSESQRMTAWILFRLPLDSGYIEFVENGGHLYISDLEAPLLDLLFPGKVSLDQGSTSTGVVSGIWKHPGLESVVGTSFDIVFDLDGWYALESIDGSVNTFIEADITNVSQLAGTRPITIGFKPTPESGCVFFSSYHIEGDSTGSTQEKAMKYLVQNVGELCQ